jgi:hypothetical protein
MDAATEPLSKRLIRIVGWTLGWGWAVVAGGGGLGLLLTRGPWPLTNGWFALFSGLAACPATAWALRRSMNVRISGWVQAAAAFAIILAGRVALALEGRSFWPHP